VSDIPLLAKSFLERATHSCGKMIIDYSQEAMRRLLEYGWPGNVRDL
jgi:DNA-binding NtrC family response regulator